MNQRQQVNKRGKKTGKKKKITGLGYSEGGNLEGNTTHSCYEGESRGGACASVHGWGGTESGVYTCVHQVSERHSVTGWVVLKRAWESRDREGEQVEGTGRRVVMLLSRDWGRRKGRREGSSYHIWKVCQSSTPYS